MLNITHLDQRRNILSRDNLTLCQANYFETCWCKFNSNQTETCPYLLRHVIPFSNSSYFCIYHTIRKTIDCFNSAFIFPKNESVSNIYIYLTIFLFIIGLIGNGLSIIILLNKALRRLSVYQNLTILCAFNIFYLLAIFIRHRNNANQDIRDISPDICRLHSFIVAFTGHLCSWQLVSMSIQRVHALLSLQSHRQTSWRKTSNILIICIVLPLFVFDGQLLFNYGLFARRHMCDEPLTYESKQFQRALQFPINNTRLLSTIPIRYHANFFKIQTIQPKKCGVCILWNIIDTFLYAIIPFFLILISSIIIIVKICERRRSTVVSGGKLHMNKRLLVAQDNLSFLLILINCLFLIMTGPFNICLIIQSIIKYFFSKTISMKIFLQINQYLRLLQNSYHAFTFIFYCLAGNKFRKSALSICQIIYHKFADHSNEPFSTSCFTERRNFAFHKPSSSTSSNDVNKRSPNSIKKQTFITVHGTEKRTKTIR